MLCFFCLVFRKMRYQNIAVEIDTPHLRPARNFTTFLSLTVLTALKETVWPDFVLNLTVAGLATVFVATNLTFFLATKGILPQFRDRSKSARLTIRMADQLGYGGPFASTLVSDLS